MNKNHANQTNYHREQRPVIAKHYKTVNSSSKLIGQLALVCQEQCLGMNGPGGLDG